MFNKKLFLVRHGQTELNKKKVIQGHIDSPLTDFGLEQAKKAAKLAKDLNIDILAASDLGRAVQTAEIINQEIGISDIKINPIFKERNFGVLEGITFDEAVKLYPQFVNKDGVFRLYNEFPKAEPIMDFYNRIVNGIENFMNEHIGKNVMIVAHGGTLRMIYAYINNIDPYNVWEIYDPGNCEIANY